MLVLSLIQMLAGSSVSAAAAAFLACAAWFLYRKQASLTDPISHETPKIPSPPGYPIIGHIPMVGKLPHLSFAELGKHFNGIFELSFGLRKVVILDHHDTIVEAFSKDTSFGGRPHVPSFEIFKASGTSYLGVEDATPKWKFLQKAVRKAIGLVTSAKNTHFEAIIGEAVQSISSEFDEQAGKPMKPGDAIAEISAAIIGSILFSRKFNRKDALVKQLSRGVKIALDFLQVGAAMDNIPFGPWFFRRRINRFLEAIKPFNKLAEDHIRSHQSTDEIRDVADSLHYTTQMTPEHVKQELGITDDTIKFLSQDLFFAGFSAVGECLHWLMNIMAACPEKQQKVYEELNQVLEGRTPTISDRSRMPYVEAVVTENCRFVSLQPLAAPHSTMTETNFRGYVIPQGTMVLCNLWAVHHNEDFFPNHDQFLPERFLSEDGLFDANAASKVLQFGVGKRKCPGECMARQELFLLLTSILQKYRIRPADDEVIDINICEPCLDRKPINYKLVFEKRTNE